MVKSILKAFGLMSIKNHEYVERQLRNEKELNKLLLENNPENWIIVGSDNTTVSDMVFTHDRKMIFLPGIKNICINNCTSLPNPEDKYKYTPIGDELTINVKDYL